MLSYVKLLVKLLLTQHKHVNLLLKPHFLKVYVFVPPILPNPSNIKASLAHTIPVKIRLQMSRPLHMRSWAHNWQSKCPCMLSVLSFLTVFGISACRDIRQIHILTWNLVSEMSRIIHTESGVRNGSQHLTWIQGAKNGSKVRGESGGRNGSNIWRGFGRGPLSIDDPWKLALLWIQKSWGWYSPESSRNLYVLAQSKVAPGAPEFHGNASQMSLHSGSPCILL